MKNLDKLSTIALAVILIACGTDDSTPTTPEICSPTSGSLTAHYPLNGNANDATSSTNHGTVTSPVAAKDRKDKDNSAYLFNGTDDIITIPDSDQLSLSEEFTISVWVNPNEVKTQEIVRKGIGSTGSGKTSYAITMSGSADIIFSISTDGSETFFSLRNPGYTKDSWYLITGVVYNEQMYLFLNGELVQSREITGSPVNDDNVLQIGTRLRLPSDTFSGVIDDLRIYNYALCKEEILALYNE